MVNFSTFEENVARVRERIAAACEKSGRGNDEVRLLPVTKNHPAEAPLFAARCGFAAVGENRVQETAEKRPAFEALAKTADLRWELIGHLQSNKAKKAVALFDRIQSVDSLDLVAKLDKACEAQGRAALPILLQANPGCDPAKFGTADLGTLKKLLEAVLATRHLQPEGFMCVAPIDDDSLLVAAKAFETLRDWRDRLAAEFALPLTELSMGMSHDLEPAIAAGSTMVRVGTALFGERVYL
ncbi:MAG: YggS family pyridoxal phosphate-dependent enzyme [Opitutales bacterium]|nr:YggS family pyridoxal phosphate-dependent enzyme [Opitutales bacterium]